MRTSGVLKALVLYAITFTIPSGCMKAQHFSAGEYHLTGVHEMVAGFRFTADGRFEFMYIYGAVDRNATGTYTIDGDTIRLKSDKEPGKDFDIVSQRKKGEGYTIHITHENSILASNVRALYFVNGERREEYADSKGVIHIQEPQCERIYVQHGIYPDIASLIKDESDQNNFFELKLNPALEQVSFKGIDLFIDGNTLTCLPNYFMPMENIVFEKSN